MWNDKASKVFEDLKERFCQEPVLAQFDPEKQIVLETDASDYAIRACLNQRDETGRLWPIVYILRKPTGAELNYDIYNKELLAIVVAFEQ